MYTLGEQYTISIDRSYRVEGDIVASLLRAFLNQINTQSGAFKVNKSCLLYLPE
jgi:hypothetical protein